MKIVDSGPRAVREIENAFIALSDGCRLAARMWLPEDAEAHPVPAILEYLPYRKRDGTAERDALTHPYLAGHGYACLRVDIRGSGDSEGRPLDEYVAQEQDDCLEAMRWIAAQPWCTGAVGMMGISWGGFNALQVAARRPPELKAVISLCSTDDRHADDAHYMGGCLLNENLVWGAAYFAFETLPPDPAVVGPGWRDAWRQRLENAFFPAATWLEHQRRDAYWRHGSVCEDYAAIACPVYLVGGWADAYTNAIPRLLENLGCPRKGLIGPWAHKFPHVARPGPAIGFLQESLRWWDRWLKGIETGIMDEPMLRVWMQEAAPPQRHYRHRRGRWVAEPGWPPPGRRVRSWGFGQGQLLPAPTTGATTVCRIASPQDTGATSGKWCPYGDGPDQAADQRPDDAHSLTFDSEPLEAPLAILGAPKVVLELAVDRPNGIVAVRLNDVDHDGAATQLTHGLLNLTHRLGSEVPRAMIPDERVRVELQLNDIGLIVPAGHRLRVSVSTAWWPLVWPSPTPVSLALFTQGCELSLPLRSPRPEDDLLAPFPGPEGARPMPVAELRPGTSRARFRRDLATGEAELVQEEDGGVVHLAGIDLATSDSHGFSFRIRPDDPLSAQVRSWWRLGLERGDWRVSVETRTLQTATSEHFVLSAELDAFEGGARIASRNWLVRIPRDLV